MNKLTFLKAKYYQRQGNKGIREAKTELERCSDIRKSLLADFERLNQAIVDLTIKQGMAEDEKEAQELAKQIGHFERTRRSLRSKYNEIVAMQEAQEQQLSEMEGQFRGLEAIFDGKKSSNLP